MRIIVVGAGRIGTFHARTLAALQPRPDLVIVDANPSRARQLAGVVGGTVAPSLDAALDAGADAVVISSPTPSHAELALLSIEAGVPLFCEKPIAATLPEAEAVADAARGCGAYVQLGFQRRFDAGYAAARAAVVSGQLGHLYVARLMTNDAEAPPSTYVEGADGIFAETLVHDFDLVRFVTGREVEEVFALTDVVETPETGPGVRVAMAVVTLRLGGGALAVVSSARHDPRGYDARIELHGSRDNIAAGSGGIVPLRSVDPGLEHEPGGRFDDFLQRFEPAYRAELAAFVDNVRIGAPSPCTADDGLRALVVVDAAYRASVTGSSVRLAPVDAALTR